MIRNSHEHKAPEPPTADRDWFGGRRWTGIAASGVILLVIVVALFLLVRPHEPESAGPARASASNTSMTSSAPEAMTPSSGSTSRLDVPRRRLSRPVSVGRCINPWRCPHHRPQAR